MNLEIFKEWCINEGHAWRVSDPYPDKMYCLNCGAYKDMSKAKEE